MVQGLAKTASKLTPKRSAKRDAILDEGARLMNRDGAGSIRLGDIAKTLGLSRNALYYYVKDRSDLVRQCYMRTCETIEQNLRAVASSDSGPAEKIRDFVRRTLLPDHPHRAALTDIAILDEQDRKQIRAQQQEHFTALSALLERGQQAGVFKQCDSAIAAHAILGMLDWVLLWTHWITEDEADIASKLAEYSDALSDCVLYGFVSGGAPGFDCPYEYSKLNQNQVNLFDRADANRLRRQQLIEAASVVFNRRGLDGASVDTIAEKVGASKGAIYHHFQDKTALIEGCYEHAFHTYELISEVSHAADATAAEILLIDFHLNCQAQTSSTPPLILQPGIMRLPEEYLVRSKALADQMFATFTRGQRTGHIRKGSSLLVEVTPGAFFWIQKWRDHSPNFEPLKLANALTSIIAAGILASHQ